MDAKARAGSQNRRKAPLKKGLDSIFFPKSDAASGDNVATGQHGTETDDVGLQHGDPTGVIDASGLPLEILNGGFVDHQKSAE